MIYPAIDLYKGRSVRLYQGSFDEVTVVNSDPVSQAKTFAAAGLRSVHIVDLDGTRSGLPVNDTVIQSIRTQTDLMIEVGGGIRTLAQIERYLALGVQRVVLGSVAVDSPELVATAIAMYGAQRIVVGIDGKEEQVAVHGWESTTNVTFDDLIAKMVTLGVRNFIVTDVSKDGTLSGPNTTLLTRLQTTFTTANVIASGGVSTIDDVIALQASGIQDVVIGRALFDGSIQLKDLVAMTKMG